MRPQQQQLVLAVMIGVLVTALHTQGAAAAALQTPQPLTISITGLTAQAQSRYTWTVTNTPDKNAVSAPVGSSTGFGQVRYTVSYSRTRSPQTTFVLSGSLVLQDADQVAQVIQLPAVTLRSTGGKVFDVPSEDISCPSLVVPGNSGQLTCSFNAEYTGSQPLPGIVSASVTIPGSGVTVKSAASMYDFANAIMADVGSLATVSNYFEQGPGVLQPYGISGLQPPPGLTLEDSREFSYLALFGEIDVAKCGQQWKVVSTAQLQASGSSNTTLTDPAVVTISLVGCSTSGSSAFAGVSSPAVAPPVTPVTPVTPVPAAASPSPAARPNTPVPAGITFAQAGSTMCGGGACAPGQRCFDGWNCCAEDVTICGGVCCDGGRVCLQNQCVPQGSIPCGASVCVPGETCTNNVCCSATRAVCGTTCCETGQTCVLGQCAATGSTACGGTICGPTQQCVSGVCCGAGETSCAGRCCGGGNICLQNQFCVPTGSSLCAGTVCGPTQQCASGMLCCDAGASVCGGTCCPNGQSCVSNRCVPPGSTPCGSNICTSAQSCQGGTVCCNTGETFCNNGCCAQGNTCINNQCVPSGSSACGATVVCPVNQFCGNSMTGLCCQSTSPPQIACGNSCCPFNQVCNSFTQTCVDRINTACGGGQQWCPSANMCCAVGQVCYLNQCVDRSQIGFGRRRLMGGGGQ